MKVVNILTVWNEIKLIPHQVEYCRQNNIDIYVIDNMSDDGTWEWLQENNVPSHRVDTEGMFNLHTLQAEILRTLPKLNPDWVIYAGCDLFTVTENSLFDEIKKADQLGYNKLSFPCYHIYNTGESLSQNIFTTYFMGGKFNPYYKIKEEHNDSSPLDIPPTLPHPENHSMIFKYNPKVRLEGDTINLKITSETYYPKGVMLNYGHTKSKEERHQTFLRRKKAWDKRFADVNHGSHYRIGEEWDWIFPKEHLADLRSTKYLSFIQKLQHTFSKK